MKARVIAFWTFLSFSTVFQLALFVNFRANSWAEIAPGKGTIVTSTILKQRDPFKEPKLNIKEEGPKSELEAVPIEKLKMLGVMTGGEHLRAMVSAPNGKTYFVQENMAIGVRKGVIKRITDKGILVREKVVNVLGDEETVETMIELPPDTKKDVKQVTSEKGW